MSELHTSEIALFICVFAWLLGPTNYCKFQMSAFKSMVTSLAMCHLSESTGEGLLPDCSVGVGKMGGKHNSNSNLTTRGNFSFL